MGSKFDRQLIGEVLDIMADRALQNGTRTEIAIERFSRGVDRLSGWLPIGLREEMLEQARAHSYCSPEQIRKMHFDSVE